MDTNSLREVGLTNTEIKVYLALLQLGPSSAPRISKMANIERAVTYHTLENLIRKGVATCIIKENKKHFSADEPEKLKELLKKKENLIDEIIPELTKIKNSQEYHFSVEFLTGKEGHKIAKDDVTNYKLPYYVLGNTGNVSTEVIGSSWSVHWDRKRIKNRIRRYLLDTKPPSKKYRSFTESRILPKPIFSKSKTSMVLYETERILLFLSPSLVVRIINREMHDFFKEYFDSLWEISKKLS